MRRFLLAGVCLVANCYGVLFAQNKTLGVGVPAPNPNAALHVESPTANQGFIMPRLTTVQRLAMNALLTGTDKGLMLYDSDLNTIFIWDGLIWKSSSEVAGGPELVYPYADSVTTSPGANSNLFKLLYGGSATESVGISHFENQNPNNTSDALKVTTNGLGTAGRFTINNPNSKMPVLWVETNSDSALSAPIYGLNTGKGDVAASFRVTNPANAFPALYAESLGTGRVATFIKNGTGSQPTVFANVKTTGHGFWAEHEGTSGYAAILQSVNPANPSGAVFIEALGTGFSLFTQKSQATSTGDVIYSEHLGTSGSPGRFVINNAANSSPVLTSSTNGTGPAIFAESSGAMNANAGLFEITNASNAFPALQVNTVGTGFAINARHTGTAGDALYAEHAGAGNGSAGNFRISNSGNTASAIYAATNSTSGGTAIGASNDANGIAFAIWNGGVQVTTSDVTTTSIATRASAYRIISGGTSFNITFGPQAGEVFMVYNDTASQVDILDGGGTNITSIPAGQGKTFVVFAGGVIRAF